MQILSSCWMRRDIHAYTSHTETHGNKWDIYIDTNTCVHCRIMHSHSFREGVPCILRGQTCFDTYYKLHSLTQAFPEIPACIQGSGVKSGVSIITLCLCLTPQPSSNLGRGDKGEEELPIGGPLH